MFRHLQIGSLSKACLSAFVLVKISAHCTPFLDVLSYWTTNGLKGTSPYAASGRILARCWVFSRFSERLPSSLGCYVGRLTPLHQQVCCWPTWGLAGKPMGTLGWLRVLPASTMSQLPSMPTLLPFNPPSQHWGPSSSESPVPSGGLPAADNGEWWWQCSTAAVAKACGSVGPSGCHAGYPHGQETDSFRLWPATGPYPGWVLQYWPLRASYSAPF